jgi:hypothetical protein
VGAFFVAWVFEKVCARFLVIKAAFVFSFPRATVRQAQGDKHSKWNKYFYKYNHHFPTFSNSHMGG